MGITNADILTQVGQLKTQMLEMQKSSTSSELTMDKVLLEKIELIISDRISNFKTTIEQLINQKTELLRLNATLIEQNKELKQTIASSSDSSDSEDSDTESICSVDSGKRLIVDEVLPSPKEVYDLLILSDSIYRHVGSDCPKELFKRGSPIYDRFTIGNLTVLKVVIPGARCDRLWAEAAVIHKTYSFDHIITHVGANYVPPFKRKSTPLHSVNQVINEIKDFLDALASLFPYSQICYSLTLLQNEHEWRNIRPITYINNEITEHCLQQGYQLLRMQQFEEEKTAKQMLAVDGVHLSRMGIKAMLAVVRSYMIHHNKYW